ncbi:MAG: hypothetical protein M3Z16_10615 [Pseudomonadota bacterium]|nr:hypothetical protein [Pseudomonadota bacterium]
MQVLSQAQTAAVSGGALPNIVDLTIYSGTNVATWMFSGSQEERDQRGEALARMVDECVTGNIWVCAMSLYDTFNAAAQDAQTQNNSSSGGNGMGPGGHGNGADSSDPYAGP